MVDLSRLRPCRVLVAGDLMLDRYVLGQVKRISPEAPVPILDVREERSRPGGAGNVALSLQALGAEAVLLSQVGGDLAGKELLKGLQSEELAIHGVMVNNTTITSVKKRLIADTQQLMRVDHEEIKSLPLPMEQLVIQRLPKLLASIDVVAVSDYAKGFLSKALLRALIDESRIRGIPVIVDPKGVDYSKYRGATLIKPNLKEALEASGLDESAELGDVADRILERSGIETLLLTRSQDGISIFERGGARSDFAVRVREVKDVTGAGDTVLTMATMAYANGWSVPEAAELANIGAGIAIEHLGCHRVTRDQLEQRVADLEMVK